MATKPPKRIRVVGSGDGSGSIYELVQTEAPTAGGSNLKKMHRAVDTHRLRYVDEDDPDDNFSDVPPAYGQPSLEEIEKRMRAANTHLEALRKAYDTQKVNQWLTALKDFGKDIGALRNVTNEENARLTGKTFYFLR